MMLVNFLLGVSLLVYSLLIYSMFNDTGQTFHAGPDYSMQNFIDWFESKDKQDLEVLFLFKFFRLSFQARSGFGGFISFGWTNSILVQLATLDRWKGIMDQVTVLLFNYFIDIQISIKITVHSDTFNQTFCDLHTFINIGGWLDGSGNNGMKAFTWFCIIFLLFSWTWFGNFVFKNLVTGIVVNNFLAYR